MNDSSTATRIATTSAALKEAGCQIVGVDDRLNGIRVRISRDGFGAFLRTVFGLGGSQIDVRYTHISEEVVEDDFRHVGANLGAKGSILTATVLPRVS